jgi:hypothetical protein
MDQSNSELTESGYMVIIKIMEGKRGKNPTGDTINHNEEYLRVEATKRLYERIINVIEAHDRGDISKTEREQTLNSVFAIYRMDNKEIASMR